MVVRQKENDDGQTHEGAVGKAREHGHDGIFLPVSAKSPRIEGIGDQEADADADQNAADQPAGNLTGLHAGKLIEEQGGQTDPVNELIHAYGCPCRQKTKPLNEESKKNDPKDGNERSKDGQHGNTRCRRRRIN